MADHVETVRGRFAPLTLFSQDGEEVFSFSFWTEETATWAIKKVSKPVERGSDITDHARRELARVSLLVGFDGPEQLAQLRSLAERFTVVDVVAGLAVHGSMMITSIQPVQARDFSIECSVEFEEYRAAESRTVQVETPPGRGTRGGGRGGIKQPTEEEVETFEEQITGEGEQSTPESAVSGENELTGSDGAPESSGGSGAAPAGGEGPRAGVYVDDPPRNVPEGA